MANKEAVPVDRLRLVDCTLRDGGYYNNWDFEPDVVANYLQAMDRCGIDVVEIGFRFTPKDRFLGPFAYSTDDHLARLALPQSAQLAVMVNASDLLTYPKGAEAAVDLLFDDAASSPVSLVRVAAHFAEIDGCRTAIEKIRGLGYSIGFNLMQASRQKAATIEAAAAEVASWGLIDVLYFADSLGNMDEHSVRDTIDHLRAGWTGEIGIHAHDNMGIAQVNTLDAIEHGATWADGTVLGMGRGAGNAKTEFLIGELAKRGWSRYNAESLLPILMGDFRTLQQRHGWGTNLLYFMSAQDDIHPTYVQMMQASRQYDLGDMVGALKVLREMEGHSFSLDNLAQAMDGGATASRGTWDATEWLQGRDVLLLGAGPSANSHSDALARFIEKNEPAVLSLNTNPPVPENLVTAYVACHPNRIVMEAAQYGFLGRPLIIPLSSLPNAVRAAADGADSRDYGLEVAEGRFEAGATGCVLPARVVGAYAMAVATAAGAKRLLFAGFDGFEATDPRQAEMMEIFEAYQRMDGALPLVAITATSYALPHSSVYAPKI